MRRKKESTQIYSDLSYSQLYSLKFHITLSKNTKIQFLGDYMYSLYELCHDALRGWSGGAMVLGKLPVPGRPTNLD